MSEEPINPADITPDLEDRQSIVTDGWEMADVFDPHRDRYQPFIEGAKPVEFKSAYPKGLHGPGLAKRLGRRAFQAALPGAVKTRQQELKQNTVEGADSLTAIKGRQEKLERAYIDQDTGLRNKLAFEEEFPKIFEHLGVGNLLVFFVDANGLKRVNDTYDHAMGNKYLRAVATGLIGSVRDTDLVYRIGGDEFVVLAAGNFKDESHEADAGAHAVLKGDPEEIQDRFNNAVEYEIGFFGGGLPDAKEKGFEALEELHPGISYGYAIKQEGQSAESLLNMADAACKAAKQRFYDEVQARTGQDLRRGIKGSA